MLCKYMLLSHPDGMFEAEISKYKFLEHGVLLIIFNRRASEYTFIPYANLASISFKYMKEDNNGSKSETILPGSEESGD